MVRGCVGAVPGQRVQCSGRSQKKESRFNILSNNICDYQIGGGGGRGSCVGGGGGGREAGSASGTHDRWASGSSLNFCTIHLPPPPRRTRDPLCQDAPSTPLAFIVQNTMAAPRWGCTCTPSVWPSAAARSLKPAVLAASCQSVRSVSQYSQSARSVSQHGQSVGR